jgi:hypothetical protein
MIAAAEKGRNVVPVLTRLCPDIHDQIRRDGKTPGLFSFWGRCVNVDENVNEIIVHPAILEAIGNLAGVSMRGRAVHAGLQHTYGYLFSLLKTPYGYKRDRWVSPELALGFGLERSLLCSRPKEGTLLANLTWFLGQIVYSTDPASLARLKRITGAVASELLDYDYDRLSAGCIAAQVSSKRNVWLYTDLVPFPHPPVDPEAVNTLLAYSIQNGRSAPIRLITAFPLAPTRAKVIEKSTPADADAEVRLQYNAYVPGLFGRTVPGQRFFSKRSLKTE